MKKCSKCAAGIAHEYKHGLHAYRFHTCRCLECVQASRQNNERYRRCRVCESGESCDFRHGTKSAYNYHGCRCRECIENNGSRVQAWRDRNPERARQLRRKHHWTHRETILPKMRARHEKHRERNKERSRAYYEEHRSELSAYRREYFGEYYAENASYVNAKNTRNYQRKQSAYPASGPRRRWTPEEDLILMRDDITLTDMAALTGRSYAAVMARRPRLRADSNA